MISNGCPDDHAVVSVQEMQVGDLVPVRTNQKPDSVSLGTQNNPRTPLSIKASDARNIATVAPQPIMWR
jgi:hypothetical protein